MSLRYLDDRDSDERDNTPFETFEDFQEAILSELSPEVRNAIDGKNYIGRCLTEDLSDADIEKSPASVARYISEHYDELKADEEDE